jgi:hypothetical protein
MGGMKQTREIELTERQLKFLTEMAEQYGLPDGSKVVRCLIDHAASEASQRDAIFAEIRCLEC